jgi:hypothetical protein
VVWAVKDQQRVGGWAWDAEKSPNLFAVLRKEFEWRTVARHPELAGHPYTMNLSLVQGSTPAVQFDVQIDGCEWSLPFRVPVQNLSHLGSALAGALEIEPPYQFRVMVCSTDDIAEMGFSRGAEEDAFEICDSLPLQLPLRQDFELESPDFVTRIVRRESPIWLDRCVFEASAFEQFVQGARAATEVEQAWLGSARVIVEGARITVVIESIDEVIGSAEKAAIRSDGAEVYRMLTKRPDASVYLHTHPRLEDDTTRQTGSPGYAHVIPSNPDVVVGHTLDALSRLPAIMPIAACALQDETEFAAYAFAHGLLAPVSIEVVV